MRRYSAEIKRASKPKSQEKNVTIKDAGKGDGRPLGCEFEREWSRKSLYSATFQQHQLQTGQGRVHPP